MSFTICKSGYTISSTDIMNNFYHVGQGNFLPMGGSSLDNTSGVYNIGDAFHIWKNSFFSGSITTENFSLFNTSGMSNFMDLIYALYASATASRIEITGLNGDTANIYKLMCKFVNNTTTISLFVNGVSSTANYYRDCNFYHDSAVTNTFGTVSGMPICVGTASSSEIQNVSDITLFARTGTPRYVMVDQICGVDGTTIGGEIKLCAHYNNTSSTLTSIVIEGDIRIGTSILLWNMGA
jgi:hypothetical protein